MRRFLVCSAVAIAVLGFLVVPAHAEAATATKTKIVLVAGNPSHGPSEHEHRAGCMLLAKSLNESTSNIDAQVSWYGWPKDESIFDGAAALVFYCDGGKNHVLNEHLDKVQALVDKGAGVVCIHYAVEGLKGPIGDKFLQWIGGTFEANWSVNPEWDANFAALPKHPITNGVQPFAIYDEWYYHMRFPEGMKNVTPILTALPPAESLSRPDGPYSGNPAARAAIAAGELQHVAWAIERPNGGRGFGFTGAHYHKNWQDDAFRKIVLNAIAWVAKVEVPEKGIESKTPTDEDLKVNLDEKGDK